MQVTYLKLKPVLLAWALAACAGIGPMLPRAQAGNLVLVAETTISEDNQRDAEQSPDYVHPDPAADRAAQDPNLAQRRKAMIAQCEDNQGVDCAKQLDTGLGAEQLQSGGTQHIIAPVRKP
jgi:hypothetical protein